MPLKNIIGQDTAVRAIRGFLSAGRIPHALLFTGPDGSGKRTSALALAQAVNCAAPDASGDACGECPSCRRIANGADVDVIVYAPGSGMEIKKEAAIEIRNEAVVTPHSAKKKFLIIDQAEKFTSEAANLLLKTFEEPPEATVFILLTANEHLMLVTIKSRALAVPFKPLSVEEAVEIVAGEMDPAKIQILHPLAKGDIGFMLKIAADQNFQAALSGVEDFLARRMDGKEVASPSLLAGEFIKMSSQVTLRETGDSDKMSERKSIIFALEALLALLEQRFQREISGNGAGDETRGRGGAIITADRKRVCAGMELVLDAIKTIQGSGHTMLTLETLFIEYKKRH